MVRSKDNIRPVAGARTSPPRDDPDLSQDAHTSAVLCTDDVSFQPHSILKRTLCEGSWLSQAQPDLAPTTEDCVALTALHSGRQPNPGASTHQGTTSRTRRIQVSHILSLLDTDNVETFELEDTQLLERPKRATSFRNETFPQEMAQALKEQIY